MTILQTFFQTYNFELLIFLRFYYELKANSFKQMFIDLSLLNEKHFFFKNWNEKILN